MGQAREGALTMSQLVPMPVCWAARQTPAWETAGAAGSAAGSRALWIESIEVKL